MGSMCPSRIVAMLGRAIRSGSKHPDIEAAGPFHTSQADVANSGRVEDEVVVSA